MSLVESEKKQWVKNFDTLATSERRRTALALVNAALNAIDTPQVVRNAVEVNGHVLRVKDRTFALSRFKRILVLGIGKAASRAAQALEEILGAQLAGGVVIGNEAFVSQSLRVFHGDHPLPSPANVEASRQMVEHSRGMTENDLALVVVSGGGSAHLCWPESEREQGRRLYHDFVKCGGSIVELNTVRKHLSSLKGGGLANAFFPATVVGLIFSDVPGDGFESVASGPTYYDETTVRDAEHILEKYQLSGYSLMETPKDRMSFSTVSNIPLVSNRIALEAMRERAGELGLKATILSDRLYDPVAVVAEQLFAAAKAGEKPQVFLAGGEPEVKVPSILGLGGRNQLLALHTLSRLKPGQLFVSFGSDGLDNGPAAGAIADGQIAVRGRELSLDCEDHLRRFDAGTFFERTGGLIITGPTQANVSDLMLLLS